jgi:hypothetical protein
MESTDKLMQSLFDWQSPELLQARVDELGELLGNDTMQRRGRPFREGYVAARFASRSGHEAVRLLREEPTGTTPDFAVRTAALVSRYETTEADVPGRKRQLEYRTPIPAVVEPMVFTSLDAMIEQMRLVTSRKAAKTYKDCAGLVVHLNPPMFSFNPEFRTESMRTATEPAAKTFREVWLLRDKGVLLWLDGKFQGWIPDDF